MNIVDPIADMLTRIRNGQSARLYSIESPFSTMREGVLNVLKEEGYIAGYRRIESQGKPTLLQIDLKYDTNGRAVISELKIISKPGRRVYSGIRKLQKFYNGLGIIILSTPKGIMSDFAARRENVAGEVLCAVF